MNAGDVVDVLLVAFLFAALVAAGVRKMATSGHARAAVVAVGAVGVLAVVILL